MIQFVPTGGIDEKNRGGVPEVPKVLAAAGVGW